MQTHSANFFLSDMYMCKIWQQFVHKVGLKRRG